MTSAIVDTFEKLKERNANSIWLWSMMLTRGLTWDNVWDVFKSGVSTDLNYNGKNSDLVPGVDMLLSLPSSPSTVVELFDKLGPVRARYPHRGSGGYSIWLVDSLTEQILIKAKGHVQCTWPQIKSILDTNRNLANENVRHDFCCLMKQYCLEKPALRSKALLHMVQTQHEFVGRYEFILAARECEPEVIANIWKTMSAQSWAEPSTTGEFLAKFFHRTNRYDIPIEESFAFIAKHPSLIPEMRGTIQAYALHNPKDDAFFELAKPLLHAYPDALMDLYATMKKDLALSILPTPEAWSTTERFEMKPLLQAYLSMPANERDTSEAQTYFANAFQRVKVDMEGFANGHCNNLMATALALSPTGVMARILALHACQITLSATPCRDDAIKEIKTLFRHDPRSKTGRAGIIKKVIPDFKDWFAMVQGLDLEQGDIWQQGLQKMAGSQPNVEIVVESSIFEEMDL